MSLVLINEFDLVALGDAIRNKTNTDDTIRVTLTDPDSES